MRRCAVIDFEKRASECPKLIMVEKVRPIWTQKTTVGKVWQGLSDSRCNLFGLIYSANLYQSLN